MLSAFMEFQFAIIRIKPGKLSFSLIRYRNWGVRLTQISWSRTGQGRDVNACSDHRSRLPLVEFTLLVSLMQGET